MNLCYKGYGKMKVSMPRCGIGWSYNSKWGINEELIERVTFQQKGTKDHMRKYVLGSEASVCKGPKLKMCPVGRRSRKEVRVDRDGEMWLSETENQIDIWKTQAYNLFLKL